MSASFVDPLVELATRPAAPLDPAVRESSLVRLVDSVGCALGALGRPGPVAARRVASGSAGRVSVWGTADVAAATDAIFANGAAVRSLDLNDTYFGPLGGGHPSDVIAGLVAAAELAGAPLGALLESIAVSYEAALALFDTVWPDAAGFDHVNNVALGACVGISRLLGLSPDHTREALAILAISHAVLNRSRTGRLGMWKGLAAPDAVAAAFRACALAQAGAEGPVDAFEGPDGYLEVVGRGHPLGGGIASLDPTQPPARILETHLKVWPLGYVAQTAVEAAISLHPSVASLVDLDRVIIRTFDRARALMADTPAKWRPTTRETADHSLPYAVLTALLTGEIVPHSFDPVRLRDRDVMDFLIDSVEVVVDPAFSSREPAEYPTLIEIVFRGGGGATAEVALPLGHAARPFSPEDLRQKFIAVAQPAAVDPDGLFDVLLGCPDDVPVARLVARFSDSGLISDSAID